MGFQHVPLALYLHVDGVGLLTFCRGGGIVKQAVLSSLLAFSLLLSVFLTLVQVLTELKAQPQFKAFLEVVKKRPACQKKPLEELLILPLGRVTTICNY